VTPDLGQLAVDVERHEASVWASCFDAAAATTGNPAGVIVDRSFEPPLAVAQAIDSVDVNRVLGLGMFSPATPETIWAVADFFASHGPSTFRIELAPVASPPHLEKELLDRVGLRRLEGTITKKWGSVEHLPPPSTDVEVRLLGGEHRDEVAELNVRAWGAWEAAGPMKTWFGATVGTARFRHYGVFDGGRLVSVQALSVSGELGWVGFAATHPRYRGRFGRAINVVLLGDARALGCRFVHTEVETRYAATKKSLLERLYDRTLYSSVPSRVPLPGRWVASSGGDP
jgi:hypothetical protein